MLGTGLPANARVTPKTRAMPRHFIAFSPRCQSHIKTRTQLSIRRQTVCGYYFRSEYAFNTTKVVENTWGSVNRTPMRSPAIPLDSSLVLSLHEFYKKGQEKTSSSTGRGDSFSRSSPL